MEPRGGSDRPSLALSLTYEGRSVRMVGTPEAPEWIAADVCAVLELAGNTPWQRIPAAEKGTTLAGTPGGPQKLVTVKLPGLLRLVMRSNLKAAEDFQNWTLREVMPCVLRHGCYPAPAEAAPVLDDQAIVDRAFLIVRGRVERLEARVAVLEPKAEAHDRLSSAEGLRNLQEVGKALGIGANRLQWRMEADGILFRGRHGVLEPKQEHVDCGRFVLRIREDGGRQYAQTLVTGKGTAWIAERYTAKSVSNLLDVPQSYAFPPS